MCLFTMVSFVMPWEELPSPPNMAPLYSYQVFSWSVEGVPTLGIYILLPLDSKYRIPSKNTEANYVLGTLLDANITKINCIWKLTSRISRKPTTRYSCFYSQHLG